MNARGRPGTSVGWVVLPFLSLLALTACASAKVRERAVPDASGGSSALEVWIHASPQEARSRVLYDGAVVSRLVGVDDPALVREWAGSRASIEGLSPGCYRLEEVKWMGDDGQLCVLRGAGGDCIRLQPGQTVTVAVVLSPGRGPTASDAEALAKGVLVPFVITWVVRAPVPVPAKAD